MQQRILLKLVGVRPNTVIYSPVADRTALRTDKIYIEKDNLPDEFPTYITMRLAIDDTGAFSAFADFFLDAVAHDAEGKLTIDDIWTAWAQHNEADVVVNHIKGVSRTDVPEYVRDILNLGVTTRLRIDGEVTRCWTGYRIN